MTSFRLLLIPDAPDFHEHSVEPGIEYARAYLTRHVPRAWSAVHVAIGALSLRGGIRPYEEQRAAAGACVAVESPAARRVWFVRIDKDGGHVGPWVDVTDRFRDLKALHL